MRPNPFMSGRMRQGETPNWSPLEQLLGSDELCAHFMWMFDVVLDDGKVLNAYKHRWTRRYFHLTDDARTFGYVSDGLYPEVDPHTAINNAFAGWDRVEPSQEERMASRAALGRAATQWGSGARPHKVGP